MSVRVSSRKNKLCSADSLCECVVVCLSAVLLHDGDDTVVYSQEGTVNLRTFWKLPHKYEFSYLGVMILAIIRGYVPAGWLCSYGWRLAGTGVLRP